MTDAPDPELDRTQKLLISVDRAMRILEIGPSFSPIAPKRDGWNSYALDHADAVALRAKYASCPDVDISKIEEVDFVCPDGNLQEVVPETLHGGFDCCIASHVLEHMPDFLRLFHSLDSLLAANAVISLALPDKRYCLDCFKPVTTTADVLYAHHRRLRRHTKKTAFEHFSTGVLLNGSCGWGPQPVPDLALLGTVFEANRFFSLIDETEAAPYVDFHCWYLTPASFSLIILELGALGYLGWHIERAFPTAGCEFFATLRRGKPDLDPETLQQTRLNLLKDTVAEVAEQHQWLVAPAAQATSVEPIAPAEATGITAPSEAQSKLAGAQKWRRKFTRKMGRKITRMVRSTSTSSPG